MNIFWIYDLPMTVSFLLVAGTITFLAVMGAVVMRPFVKKWWEGSDINNYIAFYLSAVGTFYGITLGLLAAGVWQNFESSNDKVVTEASAIGALYRDIESFPVPKNEALQKKLAAYTDYLIDSAWVLHQQGIKKTKGTVLLDTFQQELYSFEPKSQREMALFQEALRQFNKTSELRHQRLDSVTDGVPLVVWFMIILGCIITLSLSWIFHFPSSRLHLVLNGFIGLGIGTIIFLILMLDYPFRGELSISPDPYMQIRDDLMYKYKKADTPLVNDRKE